MAEHDKVNEEAEIVAHEAQQWVIRLTSGEATAADAEALQRWRQQSRSHRRAFAAANLAWDRFGHAAAEVAARPRSVTHAPSAAHALPEGAGISLRRRAFLGGAAAAAAAAYAWIDPPLELWPSLSEMTADYRTEKGQQQQIALEGDVSVRMNTRTSLSVLPAGVGDNGAKQIHLIAGEVAITAGPRTTEPLAVVAAAGRAIATNARLNIRCDDDKVCVTCLEGEADVACHDQLARLSSHRQVTYTAAGLSAVAAADAEVVTAWQRGMLVFRSDPLRHVVDEVNRYRPGRIVLMNERLGREPVVATFRIDRIDEVVGRLQAVLDIKVRTLPAGIVLLG